MTFLKRNSLVTRVLIIFIIFNMISIFAFTLFIFQKDRQKTIQNIETTIQEIAMEKAEVINLTMDHAANESENLAMWTMEYVSSTIDMTLPSDYRKSKEGVLYRKKSGVQWSESHSSIFFPANIPLNNERIQIINATEKLEPQFKALFERTNYYQWTYIATEDGLLRIYPYSGIDMYKPYHQQKYDPFYVVANEANNPDRKAVWTKPYVDYLGTGWMITCSSPLYRGDKFFGVACVDVRLDTLQKNFLADFRLSDTGFAYVLDRKGDIIYHPNFLPVGEKQGQMFLTNIIHDTHISNEYKSALEKVLSSEGVGFVSYFDRLNKDNKKLIAYAPITGQDWILAVEISYDDYMAMGTLNKSNFLLYILIIAVTLLIFSIFLHEQYSRPITALEKQAQEIAKGNYELIDSPSNHMEIKALTDAFNIMCIEIKRFTESLIQKNKEIESIFNSIGGLLMIISPDYDILMLNENGKKAFEKGIDPVGKKCYCALLNGNERCKDCKIERVIKTKKPTYSRMAIKGEFFNNGYFPILDFEKEVVEVVIHSQRITKSVLMEKELLQTEKLAGIGQVSSAIAHELKNPLAIIRGSTYLLEAYTKEQGDTRVEEVIHTISSTVESAEKTIYNLLDFSGQSKGNLEWIDVSKVINQILFLSNRERIQNNIITETQFDTEPLLFYGQVEPLKIIMQNIISNALNALSEEGELVIQGRYVNDEGQKLELTVKDNGSGVPEQVLENIYNPFFTTDTTGKGTGLGLWITKMMVKKMEGEISIETEKGKGTTFTVKLPVIKGKRGMNGR